MATCSSFPLVLICCWLFCRHLFIFFFFWSKHCLDNSDFRRCPCGSICFSLFLLQAGVMVHTMASQCRVNNISARFPSPLLKYYLCYDSRSHRGVEKEGFWMQIKTSLPSIDCYQSFLPTKSASTTILRRYSDDMRYDI